MQKKCEIKKSVLLVLFFLTAVVIGSQSVTPSGAFSYTYPIDIPDGINGMQPDISLTYNSQAGNGSTGIGWNLNGFPTISRDTSYPVNWSSSDQFIYNGQRLIKDTSKSNIYHAEEISFEKIEFVNGSYWVVTQKNGTKYYFGNTSDSKIEAVGRTEARVWALSKVVDSHGNYYVITYEEDTDGGGDYYPKNIRYTLSDNIYLSKYKEIVFDYELRPDKYPVYKPSKIETNKRLSNITVNIGGHLFKKYKISYKSNSSLSSINIIQEIDSDGKANSKPTVFEHFQPNNKWVSYQSKLNDFSPSAGYSSSTKYPVIAGDWNGDGRTDIGRVAQNGVSFYIATSSGWSAFNNIQNTLCPSAGYSDSNKYPIFTGDWNGDGKTDIGRVANKGVVFYISTESGWTRIANILNNLCPSVGYSDSSKYPIILGDWNGDGRTDIGRVANKGLVFYTAADSGWSRFSNIVNDLSPAVGYSDSNKYPIITGDWNGDGKTDVGRVANRGIVFYIAKDSGWSRFGNLANDLCPTLGYSDYTKYPVITGDWNGDGKNDVGRIHHSGVKFYISTGSGWSTFNSITNNLCPSAGFSDSIKYPIISGDWNGDGISDIGRISQSGTMLYISTGSKWLSFSSLTNQLCPVAGYTDSNRYPIFTGDWNGDGATDIGRVDHTGLGTYTSPLDNSQIISRIVLPTGASITPVYKSAVQLKDAVIPSLSSKNNIANKYPRNLVTSITLSDSQDTNKTYETAYEYYNGKIRNGFVTDRKNLGFEWIRQINPDKSVIKTCYYQEHDSNGIPSESLAGKIKRQEVFGNDNLLYSATEIEYGIKEIQAENKAYNIHGINFIYKVAENEYDFNGVSYTNWNILKKSNNFINTELRYSYDNSGNIISVIDYGDKRTPSDDTLTETQYAINNTSYITVPSVIKKYSYPINSTNFSTLKTVYNLESHEKFYYDGYNALFSLGHKGELTKKVEFNGIVDEFGDIDKSKYPDLVSIFTYDKFGNINSVTDGNGNTEAFLYDAFKSKIISKTNPLGQVEEEVLYDHLSRLLWKKDINNEYTWYKYDIKNRVIEIATGNRLGPERVIEKFNYSDISNPDNYPKWIKKEVYSPTGTNTENYITSYTYLDNLGNQLQIKTEGLDESGNKKWLTVSYYNDLKSGERKETDPYLDSKSSYEYPNWSALKHISEYTDAKGRLYKTVLPDGFEKYIKYGLKDKLTLTRDSNGIGVVKFEEVYGRNYTEYSYPKGFYNYSDLNNFDIGTWSYKLQTKTAFDATELTETAYGETGNKLTTYFDLLGRKISYNDPDMGTWSYEYDKNGNLILQKDSKGNTIHYEYDELNRVVKKIGANITIYVYDGVLPNGTIDSSKYGPDCLGQLTELFYKDGSYSETYYYNHDTKTYKVTKNINGRSRTVISTLDEIGRVMNEILPNKEKVSYSYREDGNIASLDNYSGTSYINNIKYNHLGKVKSFTLGDGSNTVYDYNNRNQLIGINIANGSKAIAKMSFKYDRWGNINYKNFSDGTLTFNESYAYDDFFRLKSAISSENLYGEKFYSYDNYNNITSKNGLNYKYSQVNGKPHAVSEIENDLGQVVKSYEYDANGNVVKINGQSNLIIRAKAKNASDIPATMELWLGGHRPEKTWLVRSSEYQDYTWNGVIPDNSDVKILFTYNKNAVGTKPILSIDYAIINGVIVQSESSSVLFDPGNTVSESFDNLGVIAGKEHLLSTGSLQYEVPAQAKSPIREIKYDSENRVVTIKDNGVLTSSYTYDDNGQRIKKEENGKVTYYFFNNYEEVYDIKTSSEVFEKSVSYCFANGQRVAYTEKDNNNIVNTFYYHSDHLSSAVRITNASGNVIQSMAYTPFGEVAWFAGENSTSYTYTGQESDFTGFMYYNARYYDPVLGRFLQADSYLDGMNRYTYCGNNPIIYNDPTGQWVHIVIGAAIGAIAGGFTGAKVANDKGIELFSGNWWAHVGVGIGIGAVAGASGTALAAAGVGGSLGASGGLAAAIDGAIGGAVGGFISNFGNTVAFGGENQNLFSGNMNDALVNGGIGAAFGFAIGFGLGYATEAIPDMVSKGLENFDGITIESHGAKVNVGETRKFFEIFPAVDSFMSDINYWCIAQAEYLANNPTVLTNIVNVVSPNVVEISNTLLMYDPSMVEKDPEVNIPLQIGWFDLNSVIGLLNLKYAIWDKGTKEQLMEY